MTYKLITAFVVLFMTLFSLSEIRAEHTLIKGGKSDYTIVLPDKADPVQKTAANELQSFLKQCTGVELPIVKESEAPTASLLVIGPSAMSKKMLGDQEEKIGYDGIIIRSVGSSLVFSGHSKRGPLYAVYTFLEDSIGCRWWTSTESTIPKLSTIVIPDQSIRYEPKLVYRESFYADANRNPQSGIFSARMKTNGHFNPIPEEYGGHSGILYWAHSFYQVLPPQEYFKDHPNWYSEINGKRVSERSQLCLTNEEMFQTFIDNVRKSMRANPSLKFVSISQNDWGNYCQCPACKKINEENESPAGTLIYFVNKVAEELGKEFPDVYFETLAYQYTRKPPKVIRPRDNVVVRLCSIECSFIRTLVDGNENISFKNDIEGWSRISKNLFIWNYVTNFSAYLLPHPNWRVLAPNLRFFVKNNTIGLFEQGDTYCSAGDFVRLRNWMLSKLMWNPELKEKELIDEFLEGYYSPRVADVFRQYLRLIVEEADKSTAHIGCYNGNTVKWLTLSGLEKATEFMDKAVLLAREDEKANPEKYAGLEAKVVRDAMPIRYVWINEYRLRKRQAALENREFKGPKDIVAAIRDFCDLTDRFHVAGHHEGAGQEEFNRFKADLFESYNKLPAKTADICNGKSESSWYDVQENEMRLAQLGTWVFLEKDEAASDGRAARMPASHTQWAVASREYIAPILKSSNKANDKEQKDWCQVYISVRCDAVAEQGNAMLVGIYDEQNRKEIYKRMLTIKETAGKKYRLIELGKHRMTEGCYIWVAPLNNPKDVKSVFVDRFLYLK